ncbi:hypothetical protein FSP39_015304 [Pinctada imbricata]|uniref:Ubiquitin-like protease family profile domain-containing protein n=1 Tax=Pinctada imbricata TaxID=66713 RepID=A0AA88YIJ9_PINIB|nr:hypothetical protein FSP39_015304 [Pinctada imbricata]
MNSYLTLLKVEKNMGATHIFVLPSYTAVHWERGLFHPWLFKKVQFSNFEKILMPVNVNGNHWVLFVADMVYKTVGVLDSLGGSHEFKYITYWRKFLETRKQHVTETIPGPWTLEPYPTNLQTDGNSCGVFTLMNAECLVKNEPVNIMRQVHVPAFRRHVRSAILAKGQRKTDRYCDWPECSSRRGHQRWIQCSVCGRWFHTRCVAIPIKAAIEEDFECVFCCAIYH